MVKCLGIKYNQACTYLEVHQKDIRQIDEG